MASLAASTESTPLIAESREKLKAFYRSSEQSQIQHFFSGKTYPLRDIFINLAIVETKQQKAEAKEPKEKLQLLDPRMRLLNSWDELHTPKEPIDIEDLWKSKVHEDGPKVTPRHFYVERIAGIDKTTLSRYSALRWAKGLWQEKYQWIFLIPLRNLLDKSRYPQKAEEAYDFLDVVFSECFDCPVFKLGNRSKLTQEKSDELLQEWQSNEGQVLYILDGLDEVASITADTHPHVFPVLGELRKQKHAIITSRLGGPLPEIAPGVQHLITLGFLDADIPRYIQKF
jgi:hypothetical protein